MFHARDFEKIDPVLEPRAPTQAEIDAAMARSRELRAGALRDLWARVMGGRRDTEPR
ncbi:MAG: hypothetical protein AAGC92_13905 [Pseudomonadota bacterium]